MASKAKKPSAEKKIKEITVRVRVSRLASVINAFDGLLGRRTTQQSFELVQRRKPVDEFYKIFMENLKPFVDTSHTGPGLKILEGKQEEVTTILNEEVEFSVLPIKLETLNNLEVESEESLLVLLELGIIEP